MSVVANVAINVDARQAAQNLQQLQKQSTAAANSIEKTGRSAASASANIQRFGIAFRSVVAPVVAITGAVNILSRSLRVLGERQADAAALENGLRKIGGTRSDLRQLQQVADQLGKQTLFNQEDFDRGFALLTSFQSIAIGSYERVAKAAADVAQVTKQDVNSSLLQLAKALQDPEKGLTALARSGTQFTETQKDLIKSLVEAGKQTEAQDYILREIEKQYGNAAAAAGSAGYAGAVDSLQESFRDFQERLATGVEPAVIGTLKALTDLFDLASKIPKPVGNAALAIGAVATAVIGLRAAIVAVLPVAKALLAFALANPWIALAAGITAAAVALAGYRSEAEKVAGAARTGTSADVAAARNLAVQKGQSISLLEARRGQATGRERASIDRQITKLRREQADLLDAARQNALDNVARPFVTTPDTAGGGEPGKDKNKDKAAEEAKRLADELKRSLETGNRLGTEFKRQVLLLGEADEIERKRLQIQFDFEDRAKQISELKNAEQQTNLNQLNAEIQRLELIDLQTEALKKQAEEADNLFKKAMEGAEFGVDGEGTVADGLATAISKLKDELDPVKLKTDAIVNGAFAIGDAFSKAFGEVITGAKSTQKALADAFKKIGDAFISMAVEIIAKQMTLIILQTIFNALSGASARATAGKNLTGTGALAQPAAVPGLKIGGYAEGGFVTGPTNALIGEGGEPEYVIPQSKMSAAMSRYSRGARGESVIPGNGTSTEGGGAATATMEPIDVRYSVERINNVDYVTADQFQAGMAQAAQQGAIQGERRAMRSLKNSAATRRGVGI